MDAEMTVLRLSRALEVCWPPDSDRRLAPGRAAAAPYRSARAVEVFLTCEREQLYAAVDARLRSMMELARSTR